MLYSGKFALNFVKLNYEKQWSLRKTKARANKKNTRSAVGEKKKKTSVMMRYTSGVRVKRAHCSQLTGVGSTRTYKPGRRVILMPKWNFVVSWFGPELLQASFVAVVRVGVGGCYTSCPGTPHFPLHEPHRWGGTAEEQPRWLRQDAPALNPDAGGHKPVRRPVREPEMTWCGKQVTSILTSSVK